MYVKYRSEFMIYEKYKPKNCNWTQSALRTSLNAIRWHCVYLMWYFLETNSKLYAEISRI